MITWLPYQNYRKVARILDSHRITNQIKTNYVLMKLSFQLTVAPEEPARFYSHPAFQMWHPYQLSLLKYQVAMCEEQIKRGKTVAMLPRTYELVDQYLRLGGELSQGRPKWLGMKALHISHQSNLVHKDPERYRKYFPDVPDHFEYFWPTKVHQEDE